MDRRRFLKYAGAGAAVVGASALGLDYMLTQPATLPQPIKTCGVTGSVQVSTTNIIPSFLERAWVCLDFE
ncbi:MAG: twin-arginine translocation signal domain-containing protein [Candidatus Bathyarchaeia archaeon]